MVKDEKSNKEILHPRVLGQHPLRLPPDYLPERSYNEIFNAIEKLEGQIWKEMEVSINPKFQFAHWPLSRMYFRSG